MIEDYLEESVSIAGEGLLFQTFERRASEPREGYYYATIEVSSPTRFEFLLATPDTSAKAIAEVLYSDPTIVNSSDTLRDIIAELANTIAGTLARRSDEAKPVTISPPTAGHGILPRNIEQCVTFASGEVELVIAITVR